MLGRRRRRRKKSFREMFWIKTGVSVLPTMEKKVELNQQFTATSLLQSTAPGYKEIIRFLHFLAALYMLLFFSSPMLWR